MRAVPFARKNKVSRSRRSADRGVALIAALLLLLLISGMTVAMVISSNSDMLINGYYRGYRGSFYAADSGLNVARQLMVNQLVAAGSTNFSVTSQPIPAGTESAIITNVNTAYGAAYQAINTGIASASMPEQFQLDPTGTTIGAPTCTVIGGGGTCAVPTGAVTGYSYVYTYTLRALGRSRGNQVTTLSDSGTIKINVAGNAGNANIAFSAYGMFIDQYGICDGSTLVPGTITGPVFTNGAWNFGSSGSYIFTDPIGSVSSNFGYQHSDGSCDQTAATSDKYKGTTIAPKFQSAVNLGSAPVPLPPDDYNQKRAVLDGKGTGNTPVTNADLNANLKNISQTPYPVNGTTSGVYLPYAPDPNTGVPTFTGGGIYVQGDASVTLSTSGTSQVFNIVQNGVATTIHHQQLRQHHHRYFRRQHARRLRRSPSGRSCFRRCRTRRRHALPNKTAGPTLVNVGAQTPPVTALET